MKNLKFKHLNPIHLKFKIYNLKLISAVSILLIVGLLLGITQVSAYLSGKSGSPVTNSGHAMRQPAAVTNGLVGWWKMDEKTGTTIYDSSGNGNNGTATNGPTLNQEGKFNRAVSFDGVNDYVDFSTVLTNQTTNVTLSTWVNVPSLSDRGAFVKIGGVINDQHNNDTNSGYGFGVGGSDFQTYGNQLIGLYEGRRWIVPGIDIGIGWHMVSMIIDGSGYPIFYLDGTQKTSAISGLTPIAPLNNTYIGGYQYGASSRYFNGALDDVRIYNRALTTTEITELYAGSKPTNCDQTCVGWWKMDENAANTTVADSSGRGNNGTVQQNTNLLSTAGIFAGGLNFNGSSDYVDTVDIDQLDNALYFTYSAWVKANTLNDWSTIVAKYSSNTNRSLMSLAGSGVGGNNDVLVSIGNGENSYGYTNSNIISVGVWNHWTMVFDGTQSTNDTRLKFYLNGAQRSLNYSGTIPATTTTNAETVKIGTNIPGGRLLSGSLDDVRIYNRALSASEVNELYLSGRP